MPAFPPLVPLHPESTLIESKLLEFSKLVDRDLIESLRPGRAGSLKTRPDGTILDGHHRIKVLRDRGVNVDLLPRDVIPKQTDGGDEIG